MLTDMLIPTYVQMLGALSSWLAKAETTLPDGAEALLSARLAPDMFPLSTQVRFACRQALEGVYRLRGEAFPASIDVLLTEGRQADEHPGSIADARARIAETIASVTSLGADGREIAPDAAVAHALPTGMIFDFTAAQYARDWALPQFHFHVMTAYAILRHGGVTLGKVDYVAHLLPFVRQAPAPTAGT